MREIIKIIVHCSATKAGMDFRAIDIDKWHKQRGFKKIGYHYVVTLAGEIETGRNIDEIGAHCSGHNEDSIGICYVGGLNTFGRIADTRTKAQKLALQHLIETLKTQYPEAIVYGHNDFDKGKACPCFDAKTEYK